MIAGFLIFGMFWRLTLRQRDIGFGQHQGFDDGQLALVRWIDDNLAHSNESLKPTIEIKGVTLEMIEVDGVRTIKIQR